jgi:hypothetical protein
VRTRALLVPLHRNAYEHGRSAVALWKRVRQKLNRRDQLKPVCTPLRGAPKMKPYPSRPISILFTNTMMTEVVTLKSQAKMLKALSPAIVSRTPPRQQRAAGSELNRLHI